MEAFGTIGGGALVIKKYQASATLATAGVPLEGGAAVGTDISSLAVPAVSTTTAAGTVGLSLDTATVTDGALMSSTDILVSVAVNPDLLIRCKMNNGATADTALTIQTTTSASSDGSVATGATSLTEGILWGYDGANKGHYRRTTNTSGTVGLNFEFAIASGDRFLFAGAYPAASAQASLQSPDLVTLLTQCRADNAVPGDNDLFQTFDVLLGDEDDDGANNSFWIFVQNQSAFGSSLIT